MDTLDGSSWDVVISGTGLPQSLLALSLSRAGKKILHLDRNSYYGGDEAALSLSEAAEWANKHGGQGSDHDFSGFSHASIAQPPTGDEGGKLGSSRAYSLALAPQLVYARSNILPALVSSKTDSQIEFQAVGSWFTVGKDGENTATVTRVPSGREDIFRDDTLDLRAKRALMKFIRFVGSYEEEPEQERWQRIKDISVSTALKDEFGLSSSAAIQPLLALTLTSTKPADTTLSEAVPRISRHLKSIGIFGAGFGAVLPKWGGLAEIAQVACRACAVGGGVYVLGKGIADGKNAGDSTELQLTDGEKVTTQWLVGCPDDLPTSLLRPEQEASAAASTTKSVNIISSPLKSLFPAVSEGGVTPAGEVVVVNMRGQDSAPVTILVHSSESGECPAGQCVLYASTPGADHFEFLDEAVSALLLGVAEDSQKAPEVIWKLQYVHTLRQRAATGDHEWIVDHSSLDTDRDVIVMKPLGSDVVLGDEVLDDVMSAWTRIVSEDNEDDGSFLRFEAREENGENEDEGIM